MRNAVLVQDFQTFGDGGLMFLEREAASQDLTISWYFKEAALIDRKRFTPSETHTTCGWKGE